MKGGERERVRERERERERESERERERGANHPSVSVTYVAVGCSPTFGRAKEHHVCVRNDRSGQQLTVYH